ncbi:MAG: DHA2 family efflux MFS transporter permease subunit, partial [Solirubrobacteraceae bacterium]
LDALVVSTALGAIRSHLGASIDELEWTVNAYALSFAVLLVPAAALGYRLGRRRLFAVGLGLFVLGSIACALSPNAGLLIAARAVQGSAAALVAPLSLALVSTAFGPERRAWAMGIYGGITGIAVLGGPVIGGAVTQGLAWQWVFWINVPIGLAAIPLVLTRIPESYGPRARLDVPGLTLVTVAAIGIVWGLMRGNNAGWGSAEVIATLTAGIAALVAFVFVERRAAEPMLPPRMFAHRGFSAGTASNFLFSASLFSAVFFMAQFQQISLGQGPLDSGLRLLPWTATLFIVAPIAGSLINRVGERTLVTLGLTMQAAGFAWVAAIASPHMAYWHMIAPLVIAGTGISMAIPSA